MVPRLLGPLSDRVRERERGREVPKAELPLQTPNPFPLDQLPFGNVREKSFYLGVPEGLFPAPAGHASRLGQLAQIFSASLVPASPAS